MTLYHQTHATQNASDHFAKHCSNAEEIIRKIREKYTAGDYPFLSTLKNQDEILQSPFVEKVQKESLDLYVFGTGGSSLGAKTLCELKHAYAVHSFARPRVHFLENIDPSTFKSFLSEMNLEKSAFLIVSKSGSTAETLFQFLALLEHLPDSKTMKNVAVITEIKDSPLHRIAEELKLEIIPHPNDIGGRFSIFSVVGLIPALIAGVDCKKLKASALSQLEIILSNENQDFIEGLALMLDAHDRGTYAEVVMMPYLDRLVSYSFWFRQLWAESLGKEGKGMTPLQSLGTVDQHSLLQLYADGPKNKIFNVLGQRSFDESIYAHPIQTHDARLEYMNGASMGDLLSAENLATIQSLRNNGAVVREFTFERLNEEVLGGLLVHAMIEVIALALYQKIDAFDQPAVEESKILTREYLKKMRVA
ncbi:MAG: glucose-6-phosphate isomerase [Candidatus Nucleicultricaceae bacterium]